MRVILPLLLGTALWGAVGWSAYPRELWDASAFWQAWPVATLLAAAFGGTRESRPLRDTGLLFAPIIGVLIVTALLTGGSASLLPLGMILVAALALPGLALAWAAHRLTARRR
jgi:hypothetical protein